MSKKFTQLTPDTSPAAADLVATAKSPFGAGSSRKVTLANLLKQIFLADATQLNITTITDGEFLKRSGTNITSGTPSAGGTTTYAMLPWMGDCTGSAGIGVANQVNAVRFTLDLGITVNSISFRVAGGSGGTHAAVGVYNSAGTTLLVDSGPQSSASNVVKTAAIASVVLSAGTTYLYAWTADSAIPVMSGITAGVAAQELINGGTANIFSAANASVAGQLPATLGALSTLSATSGQIFAAKVQN